MGKGVLGIAALISATSISHSANQWSRQLMALSEAQRNTVWTNVLRDSGENCDHATRTFLQAESEYEDAWNVGCANGVDFSISVYREGGRTKALTCKQLDGIQAVFAKLTGKPAPGPSCWRKRLRPTESASERIG